MTSIMSDQLGRHQVRKIYEFDYYDAGEINFLTVRTVYSQPCKGMSYTVLYIYNRLYCSLTEAGKQTRINHSIPLKSLFIQHHPTPPRSSKMHLCEL